MKVGEVEKNAEFPRRFLGRWFYLPIGHLDTNKDQVLSKLDPVLVGVYKQIGQLDGRHDGLINDANIMGNKRNNNNINLLCYI